MHLLWNCCKTQQFLKVISHWLSTFNIQCNITEEHFIFGLQRDHSTDMILNFYYAVCKILYFLAKCKNQQLFISVFQKKLQVMYRVHKQIAFSKNEEDNFWLIGARTCDLLLVLHKFIAFTKIKLCHCAQIPPPPISLVFLSFESSFKGLPGCKMESVKNSLLFEDRIIFYPRMQKFSCT